MATKKKSTKKSEVKAVEAETVTDTATTIKAQEETIKNQSDHLAQLGATVADLKATVEAKDVDIVQLKDDLKKTSLMYAEAVNSNNEREQAQHRAYNDLKGELELIKNELIVSNGKYTDSARYIEQLKTEIAHLKSLTPTTQVAELKDQLSAMATERDYLAAQVETLKASQGVANVTRAASAVRAPRAPKVAPVKDPVAPLEF